MHFASHTDADLLVPSARAYVGEGAADFISHEWTRQFEHFPIAMAGSGAYGNSGSDVRVFSDGIFGVIVKRFD